MVYILKIKIKKKQTTEIITPRWVEEKRCNIPKVGKYDREGIKSSFVPTANLSNFASNGEDDWDERHRCDAMGKRDKQSTTRWLHYLLLSLRSLTGYGRRADGCQGTLQVPHATTRGVLQSRFRELLSFRGSKRKSKDVLSYPHQIHGVPTRRI